MEALRLAGESDYMLPVALSLVGDINDVIIKVDEHLIKAKRSKYTTTTECMHAMSQKKINQQ